VNRTLVALAALGGAVAFAAGCGGSSSAKPTADPGQVMKSVIRHELSGERDASYAMLVSQQRKVVPAQLYRKCSPGATMKASDAAVGIVSVRDTTFTVPGLGKTNAKAVSYRIDFHDGNPIGGTGHLIAQDGHWRWTLSAQSLDALSKGNCP
jgi:hypothetical protein